MAPSKPTVAILGATGGTGLAVLRQCLAASLQCTVLVRTPSRLLELLKITSAPSNLRIIQGVIQDTEVVKKTLTTAEGKLVDIIVSAIGFVAPLTAKSWLPVPFGTVDNNTICYDSTRILLDCISELKSTLSQSSTPSGRDGPVLVVLSTTGISDAGRDIPILMTPLYHIGLAAPHKDKKNMEALLHSLPVDGQRWIIIRPSLLTSDGWTGSTDDLLKGLEKVRVGTERRGKVEKPAIGYTITREDVGAWIFSEVVKKQEKKWEGSCVTLTY